LAQLFDDVGECVEATLRHVGKRIVMALPLALGKPVPLVNELYRRAVRDPGIELKILTALSLRVPSAGSDLERRFLEPFVKRVFGNYPALDYVAAARAGSVPSNISIDEFYLEPGAYLDAPYVQQHYLSANYTHVARDVLRLGVNVLAQLIARRSSNGRSEISLSCNPDVTVDILPELEARKRAGQRIAVVGEVNRQLPFMLGDAIVPDSAFDFILEHPRYEYDLYCPPNLAISTTDYAIGLYASALVRDGGTLQLGIGELGDAIVYCLQLRHQQNDRWRAVLDSLGATTRFAPALEDIGQFASDGGIFEHGLYGCTEMFVDGFLDLYRSGILKRRVYPSLRVQRLLNSGRLSETVNAAMIDELIDAGMPVLMNDIDFEELRRVGILHPDCSHTGTGIRTPQGKWISADLSTPEARALLASECLGTHLREGVLLHGGFFLGPRGFYGALRELTESDRRQFNMTGVSFINQLAGADLELRVEQRQRARFINTAMMMTLSGAAVSDGLADGRVVSGVGGQYNFVTMGHALPGARSILCVRSTRSKDGRTASNIVWNYGHTTIPRHLRDVVITEYGVADLRGKTDAEIAAALLAITDSRFQDSLLRQAQAAGKLPRDYRIPDQHRGNTPQSVERALAEHRRAGLFTEYPFGTDFTAEEIVLARALKQLKERTGTRLGKARTALGAIASQLVPRSAPAELRPYLERMQLDQPANARERLAQRLVIDALRYVVHW
jgi:acyl-CoA hydrolase